MHQIKALCIIILLRLSFCESTATTTASAIESLRRKFDILDNSNVKKIRQFKKPEITWQIDQIPSRYSLSNADLTGVIKRAMDTWSAVIPVQVRQAANDQTEADIIIRFLDGNFDELLYSLYVAMAHTIYHTKPIRIHFNGAVPWVIGNATAPQRDLYTVALHEIGHALGLRWHSNSTDSLMSEEYTQQHTALSPDAVREIQALYGNKTAPNQINGSASVGHCTPGVMYCGEQLQRLGYDIRANAISDLYRCDNDGDGAYYKGCSSCTSRSAELGPFCPCTSNMSYCGYEVRRSFTNTPTEYHSLYKCSQGEQFQFTETCSGRCLDGRCVSSAGICDDHRLYCGHDLIQEGLVKTPGTNWDFNAVYNCTDMQTPVKKCPGGCVYTWGGSRCLNRFVRKD